MARSAQGQLAKELRTQYGLRIDQPTRYDGSYRRIDVRLAAAKKGFEDQNEGGYRQLPTPLSHVRGEPSFERFRQVILRGYVFRRVRKTVVLGDSTFVPLTCCRWRPRKLSPPPPRPAQRSKADALANPKTGKKNRR